MRSAEEWAEKLYGNTSQTPNTDMHWISRIQREAFDAGAKAVLARIQMTLDPEQDWNVTHLEGRPSIEQWQCYVKALEEERDKLLAELKEYRGRIDRAECVRGVSDDLRRRVDEKMGRTKKP